MKQKFDDLINNLKKTIADYKYYVDFEKVYKNTQKFKIELNILNSLIGSTDIENEFISLLSEYPKTIKAIPILIAKREQEIPFFDLKDFTIKFNGSESNETYCKFMRESGLFDLMENNKVKCLIDYVTGVEAGMDTNGRKNRTGTTMENIVEGFIKQVKDIKYYKEMKKAKIMTEFDIDLNSLILSDNPEKEAEKRFDFVVKTKGTLYLIETNFYSSSGSKLNETARSFKSLAKDIENIENIEFIWITDGVGWETAKNNLRETYGVTKHLYTLTDLENGILEKVLI